LLKGCRCVELDCWDGSGGTPDILHGNTLTSTIKFQHVVKTIRDHAFVISQYPVILSLENHCSVPQQKIMAQIFAKYFGRNLQIGVTDEKVKLLPSPEQLSYKILLKGSTLTGVFDRDDNHDQQKKKPEKIAKELSDIIFFKTVHCHNFDDRSKNCWEMSSFDEGKIDRTAKKEPEKLLQFNQIQMSRVYPKGARVDSSNYNPMQAWYCGCHMVALNFQTSSESMWLNEAQFENNGNCGYVLKPPVMMQDPLIFNPLVPEPSHQFNPEQRYNELKIEVISARFLPDSSKKGSTVGSRITKTFKKKIQEIHTICDCKAKGCGEGS